MVKVILRLVLVCFIAQQVPLCAMGMNDDRNHRRVQTQAKQRELEKQVRSQDAANRKAKHQQAANSSNQQAPHGNDDMSAQERQGFIEKLVMSQINGLGLAGFIGVFWDWIKEHPIKTVMGLVTLIATAFAVYAAIKKIQGKPLWGASNQPSAQNEYADIPPLEKDEKK